MLNTYACFNLWKLNRDELLWKIGVSGETARRNERESVEASQIQVFLITGK